jgi:hypothetical protein
VALCTNRFSSGYCWYGFGVDSLLMHIIWSLIVQAPLLFKQMRVVKGEDENDEKNSAGLECTWK